MYSWWAIFDYLSEERFEEAHFQAHLSHVTKTLTAQLQSTVEKGARDLISLILGGLDDCFTTGFKLATGLDMERLWIILKPLSITNSRMLEHVGHMEWLATRFDTVKWRSAAHLPDLVSITESFTSAYTQVRREKCDVHELLQAVGRGIDQLDRQSDYAGAPFLANEFEIIRQIICLDQMSCQNGFPSVSNELGLLCGLSLTTQMRIQSASGTSMPLQSIGYLLGDTRSYSAWSDSFSVKLLSKLDSIDSMPLSRLQSLETELPTLARYIGQSSRAIADDRLNGLSKLLWDIMSSITSVYDRTFSALFAEARAIADTHLVPGFASIDSQGLTFDAHKFPFTLNQFGDANSSESVSRHLISSLVSLLAFKSESQRRINYLGNAWLQFSVALIKMFVPDKPYDPQLGLQVELQSYEKIIRDLTTQLQSLKGYEKMRTGCDRNLRGVLLEEEIIALGKRPDGMHTVHRPAISELPRIQGEFSHLLKTILDVDITSVFCQHLLGSEGASQQISVIQANTSEIIHRLSNGFRAYEDITVPVVNMLHCLQVGLSLNDHNPQSPDRPASLVPLLELTPFLGGKLDDTISPEVPIKSFEFLEYIGALVAVEGLSVSTSVNLSLFEAIHLFYEEWRQKLETDRKAEEAEQRTYKYRGALEDKETTAQQAFHELFPSFDSDDDVVASTVAQPIGSQINSARTLSIRLAQAHRDIFTTPQDACRAIQNLAVTIARAVSNEGVTVADRDMLPATMLVLDERLEDLKGQQLAAGYNFYTDRNLPAIRKLVELVHDLRIAFRRLQQVDEIGHMQPLVDVVTTCDKVLEFGYSDPLVRIISRVEQLHAFVYEWQFGGWASKIHGVLPLYNRLTELLVGWRRLELSTWAKMLDMEAKKSYDEAGSWWFIAYQAVIAEPLALARDKQDLQPHAIGLLQQLSSYFATATVGQFTGRLDLLRQLQKQLELMTAYYPALSAINQALVNFIGFFSRYEPTVSETIRTGRTPIEKQMKDILLLASWKDTNIVALRESACRSHQRLFKAVHKFREILSQSTKPIIDAGLPDQGILEPQSANTGVEMARIDTAALIQCLERINSWQSNYKRLCNVHKTVDIMLRLSHVPGTAIDAISVVNTFISNLNSLIIELRQETPTILTEENKRLVKHLKSRKRKLLADTLKDVKKMGFIYNLSMDVLSTQDSLSAVLATSRNLPTQTSTAISNAEYFFHRMLDSAPRVRGAIQSHSEDLTTTEVSRSVGLIEDIMHAILGQRRHLEKLFKDEAILAERLLHLQAIAKSGEDNHVSRKKHSGDHQRAAVWLNHILQVSIRLVVLHCKLGSVDNEDVILHLRAFLERLQRLLAEWESLLPLPQGLISKKTLQLERSFGSLLHDLRTSIDEFRCKRPDLSFILEQVQLWTRTPNEAYAHHNPVIGNITSLADATKNLCDSILVAIQHYSKSNSELPSSNDEYGWLIAYIKCVTSSTRALHIEKINQSIENMMETFKALDFNEQPDNNTAASLISVVTSVVAQYRMICGRSIDTYSRLYQRTCQLGHILSRTFAQLASEGFCTPQEKSDQTSSESTRIEGGTGLGEGEGAEDISKEIQPDEDLSELAQEENRNPGGDVQDEKDAVDMADEELEGALESIDSIQDERESSSGDDEDSSHEMDEEAGDVDDLDPSAVDEKVWDGKNEQEADKDQQGDSKRGEKKQNEEVAMDQNTAEQDAPSDDIGNQGDDDASVQTLSDEQDEYAQQHEDINRQDQHTQEEDTLELPDDMDIDLKDNESIPSVGDDDLDNLSDVDKQEAGGEEVLIDQFSEDNREDAENSPDQASNAEDDIREGHEEIAESQEDTQQDNLDERQGKEEVTERNSADNGHNSAENVAPGEVDSGFQDQTKNHDHDEDSQEKGDQSDQGQLGDNPVEKAKSTGQKGDVAQDTSQPTKTDSDGTTEDMTEQAFRSLGDAFDKWHRQQRDIKEAQEQTSDKQESGMEQELTTHEYQHVRNDESAAETQALGTTTDDQSQPIDETMAIDDEEMPTSDRIAPEDIAEKKSMENDDGMDSSKEINKPDQDMLKDERRAGVSIRQGGHNRELTSSSDKSTNVEQVEERIQETSRRLSSTHISDSSLQLRGFNESMVQWTTFQTKTHPISLTLTAQLRLILTPSQATKLSGSYRTGKRLNIKRIIPYIASGYKRDKIWMRRTVPSKRSYQLLLCVDDSRSMGESASGQLALESLVMVSRALTMLEVGEIGVLGFGANTFMAHELNEPFASHEAGARVLQRFSFQQDYTDIHLAIKRIISQFQRARQQRTGHGSEELWQLALILSDGLTPSSAHEDIQVLLREALEERIMIVFIIMDTDSNGTGQSVLNLKKVRFLGNDEVETEYYLDSFPFQYYLIVRDLIDLPGALAGVLRTWFAEVNS